jgi:hypothetical protein
MATWQFARDEFEKCFQPLGSAGFELERVSGREVYWAQHEAELAEHFPREVFFALSRLRSEHERMGQTRLGEARGGDPLVDFSVVRKGGRLAAMFCGEQHSASAYRMWHTHVHPDFRRLGLYKLIVQSTIAYTAALGFDAVTSEHAPCNNAIIIAKLRAGFRIYGLELDPVVGPALILRYFHNPEHLAAYELRCGMATLTPGLAANGTGAWPIFREQVLAAPGPEREG